MTTRTFVINVTAPPATYLAQQAATMVAGQWKQLTVNGLSTSLFVDVNNTLDYCDKGAYDPINKQVRFFGQAHLGDQRWHQYDETTNTWSNRVDPPWDTGGSGYPGYLGHGYQHNTIDPATGDDYFRQYNQTQPRRFNRSSGTWESLPAAGAMDIVGGLEWLPTIGTQGGLVFHVGQNVRLWNKATNAWSLAASSLPLNGSYNNIAIRNCVTNEVYIGGDSQKVWKVNSSGTVTALPDCPTYYGTGSSVSTACPVSGDLIILRKTFGYQMHNGSWSAFSMTGSPSELAWDKTIAIPIPAYGVIMFLFGQTPSTWLYKHA